VIGPTIAGLIVSVVSLPALFLIDSASYLVSALALSTVRVSFNRAETTPRVPTRFLADIGEGIRFVLRHPVLRNISLMMMLFNFFDATVWAQSVLYVKVRLHASNFELGLFFAAGAAGAVIFSLLAGSLRKRFSFSVVVLGCLMGAGLSLVAFAFIPSFWVALPVWLLHQGFASLLNINTFSLRQAIVPNHLLGRVLSVAGMLAFGAIPVGSLLGGYLIAWTGALVVVFAGIGAVLFLIPLAFSFTALGRADRYLVPGAGGTS
jgi:MFS family permease